MAAYRERRRLPVSVKVSAGGVDELSGIIEEMRKLVDKFPDVELTVEASVWGCIGPRKFMGDY